MDLTKKKLNDAAEKNIISHQQVEPYIIFLVKGPIIEYQAERMDVINDIKNM